MFGRRKQEEREEAAREAERRALFEELAKRPDTICPFLGLENARTEYRDRVSDGHRCYAFGDPAELSGEQQQKVCLQRGYGNCPRYLRGVLVIPTEELEALRRPQPAPPPAAPAPVPAAAESGGGGRRGVLVIALLLLVALGGGGAAFLALSGNGGVGQATPSPTPSASVPSLAPTSSPTAQSSDEPTGEPTPTPTPDIVTSPLDSLPTPAPDDVFKNYAVVVFEGSYPVYRLNAAGEVEGTAVAQFAPGELGYSSAPVERIVSADGTRYWRTLNGTYTDLAYVRRFSDEQVEFRIYAIYQPPGSEEKRYRRLPNREL
ncbi:MAG TPA: hypothetical protein VK838_00620 [Candidatus Limnocylindrales bacterium]|nr:hypothetical protein [Candidatus Limnocylindrales bacterium]